MADIQFIRNKKYGTIGIGKNGWAKEVCNVSWNQKAPKLDIREWSPDYQKMSRGITLTKQEAKRLLAILANIDFEEFDALGVYPDTPMQVRPMYQNATPQRTAPANAAAGMAQPAAIPVSPVEMAPAANPATPERVPQPLVVSTPEIVSVSEDTSIPDGFGEERVIGEMQDTEIVDATELQSMSGPVTAL